MPSGTIRVYYFRCKLLKFYWSRGGYIFLYIFLIFSHITWKSKIFLYTFDFSYITWKSEIFLIFTSFFNLSIRKIIYYTYWSILSKNILCSHILEKYQNIFIGYYHRVFLLTWTNIWFFYCRRNPAIFNIYCSEI